MGIIEKKTSTLIFAGGENKGFLYPRVRLSISFERKNPKNGRTDRALALL
jgi:hypothetical protein